MILCGQKFGKLLVIDVAEDYIDPKSKKHIKQYLYQCDWGTIKVTRASNLKSGVSKSCGCERLKKCVETSRNNKISVNKKWYYLGLYDDINEAIKVRKEAEEKYFGEYSYDNSIKAVNI